MLKKFIASSLAALVLVTTNTVFAATVGEDAVTNMAFSTVSGANYYDVSFTLNQPAKVYAYVSNSAGSYQQVLVNNLDYNAGNSSFRWYHTTNGTANGTPLSNDLYSVYIVARSTDLAFTLDIDRLTSNLNDVSSGGNNNPPVIDTPPIPADNVDSTGIITDVELDPDDDEWDPSDEELTIELELNEDVDDFKIEAKKGNETIEIAEEDDLDDDDYDFEWDGTDDDDDYVEEGFWDIVITADNATHIETIEIEYDSPEFEEIFLTRKQINIEDEEVTDVVFKVDRDALVTIEVYYNGSRRELEIWDDEFVDGDEWYAVRWDGNDEDGDPVDADDDWEIWVTLKNEAVKRASVIRKIDIDVDDDDNRSSNRADIQADLFDPTIFDPNNDTASFEFCIDDDAEMSLSIHKGQSGGGAKEAEIIDEVDYDQGCHSVSWDGRDDDGDEIRDGEYSYKLISDGGSNKDTVVGKFVIEDFGDDDDNRSSSTSNSVNNNNNNFNTVAPNSCGGYWDTSAVDAETCNAIAWATANGIFSGYFDGSFKPFDDINRAEVLKVIFEAYRGKVIIQAADGSNLGFSDLDPGAWYMPYARTAQINRMLDGYAGTNLAGLGNGINRAEILKFALEASRAFDGFYIPNYNSASYADVNANEWYANYAGASFTYNLFNTYYDSFSGQRFLSPAAAVKRGEVALLLYRMNLSGLL